jgi:hypothetical protein
MHLLLFTLALICVPTAGAAVLFSHDYNITGLGRVDQVAFSTDIPLGSLTAMSTVELELTHSYAGELVLTLRSPTGEEFALLDRDGSRTRIGAGNGLLSGVELYTLRNPTEAALSVVDWDFTRYQPGGTYGAREWPTGSWEAGVWNLTLFNDDRSFAEDGVVGAVRITGVLVPEPSASILLPIGGAILGLYRRRIKKANKTSYSNRH